MDADCHGVQSESNPVSSTFKSSLNKLVLLLLFGLLPACAHVPGGMPVQELFVEADRTVNFVIGGDRSETITTRIANKRDDSTLAVVACGILDVVMFPFDLFATAPVLQHCDYWSRYDAEARARREAVDAVVAEETAPEPAAVEDDRRTVALSTSGTVEGEAAD